MVYRLESPCGWFYIGRTEHKLKARLAEHKHAVRTGNPQNPMGTTTRLTGAVVIFKSGIDHIDHSIRGGDKLKRYLQRKTFWIYALKATQYPGLKGELDFSPFL